MRPAIYGYMRVVADDVSEDEIARIRRELSEYASREGFHLGRIFAESKARCEPAFDAMLDALRRDGVHDVIVPSLWHFARLPGLQEAMKQHIETETGATLWVVQGQRR